MTKDFILFEIGKIYTIRFQRKGSIPILISPNFEYTKKTDMI